MSAAADCITSFVAVICAADTADMAGASVSKHRVCVVGVF